MIVLRTLLDVKFFSKVKFPPSEDFLSDPLSFPDLILFLYF